MSLEEFAATLFGWIPDIKQKVDISIITGHLPEDGRMTYSYEEEVLAAVRSVYPDLN